MYTKVRGLRSNINIVREFCKNRNPFVMCLSETHTKNEILDNEISVNGYEIVRCDSPSSHTGGVAIYVKNDIKFFIVASEFSSKTWILTIRAQFEKDLLITVIYKSPEEKSKKFFEILDKYIEENFNYITDYNLIQGHGYRQIVNSATRHDRVNEKPFDLYEKIKINNDVRLRELRYGDHFRLPWYKTTIGQKSFLYVAIKEFNRYKSYVDKHKLERKSFVENCINFYSNK